MFDENINIGAMTWKRAAESINKVGYTDGVTDGQTTSFQSSFDIGYSQGLEFGLTLGYKLASEQISLGRSTRELIANDVNCQICLGQSTMADNAVNLFNLQKEKNDELMKTSR